MADKKPKTKTPKPRPPRKGGAKGKRKAPAGRFPTRDEVLAFIQESPTPVGKREIARAFGLKGSNKIPLKALLKDLAAEGLLERQPKRKIASRGALPPVAVIEVIGIDEDGELLARPAAWDSPEAPPTIYLAPDKRSRAALAPGDRILAKLQRIDARTYEARTIRRIAKVDRRILGVYEIGDAGGRLRPTDRRARDDYILRSEHAAGAKPGELVLAEVRPGPPRARQREARLREVRVLERLGPVGDARNLSLIAIHEHELPVDFPPEALAEAEAAKAMPLGARTDLRTLPLITIDGADARDFDDAIWAEADTGKRNPNGWHIMVAIADVAAYVRPGSALDRAAFDRGTSAYFPDRVVPMLPEALSNGWCSLKPNEDRPCLVAEMWLDAEGSLRKHRFHRALMRSAARLTYEQVQAAHDGHPDTLTEPLRETVLAPLYGAYEALLKARETRGTLDLDLPERRVVMAADGTVAAIEARERLDSHRLIEEFMIAANVAAAERLEALRQPCMYRVHDQPDPVKIEALRQILDSLGVRLAKGQNIRPRVLNQILHKVRQSPAAHMVNMLVLRSQSQAVYSPANIGHFGLALTRYAHFTSPIRRYADLLVHRAMIRGLGLGKDGLPPDADGRFTEIGEHISATERRAAVAERDATDRFTAAFLQGKIGTIFAGAINGVTRFGLFVTLDDSGADGLVPMSLLPDDFYDHVEAQHALIGRRWGRVFRLGERVQIRLREAEPVTGGLILELIESDDQTGGKSDKRESARPHRPGKKTGKKHPPKKKPSGKRRRKPARGR
ncbi:MAG: ribonuclease R [Alphaproteobacteria bacterium]